MAQFLTGNKLNSGLEEIIQNAQQQLILISPYIKLHERYISVLKEKIGNPHLNIIVVFGKNEDKLSKSMNYEDVTFFTQFPNVEIKYEKRLHAKYYANESNALLTSMNLYSYSQDNNIESGVLTKAGFLKNLTGLSNPLIWETDFDKQASEYFWRVIEQSELLFCKEPVFQSGFLGFNKKSEYSEIKVNKLSSVFAEAKSLKVENEENKKVELKENLKPTAYCIRTGTKIPFNIEKPLSPEAYKSWSRYSDVDYTEKYCHFSGELSGGETSVSNPY